VNVVAARSPRRSFCLGTIKSFARSLSRVLAASFTSERWLMPPNHTRAGNPPAMRSRNVSGLSSLPRQAGTMHKKQGGNGAEFLMPRRA
jgi:hypothetical protein